MNSEQCTGKIVYCLVHFIPCKVYITHCKVSSEKCKVSSEHLALVLECAGVSKGQGQGTEIADN